tara:strand:+ start:2353 stop:2994 length:642 start_codon:yes stop_codon:yes gene_type:complete
MDILVTFAVPEEAGPFRKRKIPNNRVLVTGMGATIAAEKFLAAIEERKPEFVLTCGFCGGLNPALESGEVIGDVSHADSLANHLKQAGIRSGTCHFSDRVATTSDEKRLLFEETGCDAVEMESGAIARICVERNIPCATIRVISDTAVEDLPLDFNKLMNEKGGIRFGRLAMELARRPRLIPKLTKLQKTSSKAAKKLAESLDGLIRTFEGGG